MERALQAKVVKRICEELNISLRNQRVGLRPSYSEPSKETKRREGS